MEGYLRRRPRHEEHEGGGGQTWKRRWYVLDGHDLTPHKAFNRRKDEAIEPRVGGGRSGGHGDSSTTVV